MITYRQEDDILKVFRSGRYVGYVDEQQMLYLFNRHQEAVPVVNITDRAQIGSALNQWKGF